MEAILTLVSVLIFGLCAWVFISYNNEQATKSQISVQINTDGWYELKWFKQAGGYMRTKKVPGSLLMKEVNKTFDKAKDIYHIEECSDGYIFRRANWSHSGRREGQKFGYITARKML